METKDKKNRGKGKYEGDMTLKEKVNKWISKSPKLENMVDKTTYYIKHPDKFTERVNEIYQKATHSNEAKSLSEYAHKIRSAYRMAKMSLKGEYHGIPKGKVIVGFAAFLYLVSPIDLIPDFLPFIGFLDDAALMVWLIKQTADEVEKFEQWEVAQGIKTINPSY